MPVHVSLSVMKHGKSLSVHAPSHASGQLPSRTHSPGTFVGDLQSSSVDSNGSLSALQQQPIGSVHGGDRVSHDSPTANLSLVKEHSSKTTPSSHRPD